MRTKPPEPDVKYPIKTKENFEIVHPPVTLHSYCYKGHSACIDIDDSGLIVVITAPTQNALIKAWNRLFPKEKALDLSRCKTTVGQYEFMEGVWQQPELKTCEEVEPVKTNDYMVGFGDGGMIYGIVKDLDECLDYTPDDYPKPVFIFENKEPIYRWHEGKQVWRQL